MANAKKNKTKSKALEENSGLSRKSSVTVIFEKSLINKMNQWARRDETITEFIDKMLNHINVCDLWHLKRDEDG